MPTSWFGLGDPQKMVCSTYVFSYVGNLQALSDVCGVRQQSNTITVNIPPYHPPN